MSIFKFVSNRHIIFMKIQPFNILIYHFRVNKFNIQVKHFLDIRFICLIFHFTCLVDMMQSSLRNQEADLHFYAILSSLSIGDLISAHSKVINVVSSDIILLYFQVLIFLIPNDIHIRVVMINLNCSDT